MSEDVIFEVFGYEQAIENARKRLEALGPKKAGRAIARSINRALSAAKTEAGRIARELYTAPGFTFGKVYTKWASGNTLNGKITFKGHPGRSLIHFRAKPKSPNAKRPKEGVTVQTLRAGPRHVPTGKKGKSKPFIMKTVQGGLGVFSRWKVEEGERKDETRFEMLLGPSAIQALQRKDSQERIQKKIDDVLENRLNHEIDALFAGYAR